MQQQSEYILLKNSRVFWTLNCEQIENEIQIEWRASLKFNRAARDLDFDRLFGFGQIARLRGCHFVEKAAIDFIKANDFADAWDIISIFLMGYWRDIEKTDPLLIEIAVSALRNGATEASARDQTICALAAAWDVITLRTLKSQVLAAFQETTNRAGLELQEEAKKCIKYVVGQSK